MIEDPYGLKSSLLDVIEDNMESEECDLVPELSPNNQDKKIIPKQSSWGDLKIEYVDDTFIE